MRFSIGVIYSSLFTSSMPERMSGWVHANFNSRQCCTAANCDPSAVRAQWTDKQTVTSEGRLTNKCADEMYMELNLLAPMTLGGGEKVETDATSASANPDMLKASNMRNWVDCVRSRKTLNARIETSFLRYRHGSFVSRQLNFKLMNGKTV
jgi:hypothetical protein